MALVDPPTANAPILLLLHGLEGTVNSTYAQAILGVARSRGWGGAMLIFRTCDGRVPAVPRLYHSGETTDTDFFVREISTRFPNSPLLCVGVSLGGNVLLKWLGEQGQNLPGNLRRAAAVSVPFDLGAGSKWLEYGFRKVYQRHFVRSLKRKAERVLDRHPNLPVSRGKVRRSTTLWEFDDVFTSPVHGFSGAEDYYSRSSSLQYLSQVQLPTLLLSAEDDPFVPPVVLERARQAALVNDFLTTEFTARGGHVGWVTGNPWSPGYFMESRVMHWLSEGIQQYP